MICLVIPTLSRLLLYNPYVYSLSKLQIFLFYLLVNERILFTSWVGQAWKEVAAKEEMMKRSFIKTGIAVVIDGSQDSEINIEGLEGYKVESEDYLTDDLFSEDEDEANHKGEGEQDS